MCPVQDLALVMDKANRVRQKHWIWTEAFQILKVGGLQVLIQVCCQFDIFCCKSQRRWAEVFAQRGKSQGRAAQQTQGMPALSNARWRRTRWQSLSCSLLGRCTNLLRDSTESIAQHFSVWGRHASWGIFWADINSFCVLLMKSVSKGFCVLMFKVLIQRKGRINILSTLFVILFLHCEVKMKGYIYTQTTQEEFLKKKCTY